MTRVITEMDKSGWGPNTPIDMDDDLKTEFKIWLKMEQVRLIHVWRPEMIKMEQPSKVSFTDSSIFAWGVMYFTKEGIKKRYTQYIPEEHISQPIHIKEAMAIWVMLENDPEEFSYCTIVHYCDNEGVALGYRNLGTSTRELNKWITKIYEKLNELHSVMRFVSVTEPRLRFLFKKS